MSIQRLGALPRGEEPSLPLEGYIKLYNAHLKTEGKTDKTIKIYNYALSLFSNYFTGEEGRPPTLNDFTADNVRYCLAEAADRPKWSGQPWAATHAGERVAGATLHQYTRSLKSFGAWLAREGHTEGHPLFTVRLPKLDQRELVPLSPDEEERLLAAYDERRLFDCRTKAILMVLLDTGIRAGELVRLRLDDLNLEEGFMTVLGKRRERSIPFGHGCERILRMYLTFHRPEPATPEIDRVFLTVDGYPLTEAGLRMIFERVKHRTGIARLHPHLLRHTYALRSQELHVPVPVLALQQYLGHSSPMVTERYVHAASSERLKRARQFSHLDALNVRVRRSPSGRVRHFGRREV
jgi:site-specific recombinase XerD